MFSFVIGEISMVKEKAKDRILKAAWKLLLTTKDPDAVTVREVAKQADVGIGLINYHFKSKDTMLIEALGRELDIKATMWSNMAEDESLDPMENLCSMIMNLIDVSDEYMYLIQMAAKNELLQSEIMTPLYFVPYIKKITGQDELTCKLKAYSLTTTIQLMSVRKNAFSSYIGVDINDKDVLKDTVMKLINNIV